MPPALLFRLFTSVLLIFSAPLLSQTAGLSGYELSWALSHPGAAIKVKKIKDECDRFFDKRKFGSLLDTFENGGKLDAFRHIFYMAAFAQKVKVEKLRKLGQAHEKNNYRQFKNAQLEFGEPADSLSTVMDLNNNETGFRLGMAAKDLSYEELSNLAINSLKKGEALIMRRNKRGFYIDCFGREIEMGKFRNKWHIPKCLVASDYTYVD